jgi:putative ABC transport system permease protein
VTEQRVKEIGIRKTLGASVSSIVVLLAKEFTRWVLAANIIAWPLAYIAMNYWLQNFAYRTALTPWPFLLAAAMAFVIALATVAYQTVKAAAANPVASLRYE